MHTKKKSDCTLDSHVSGGREEMSYKGLKTSVILQPYFVAKQNFKTLYCFLFLLRFFANLKKNSFYF